MWELFINKYCIDWVNGNLIDLTLKLNLKMNFVKDLDSNWILNYILIFSCLFMVSLNISIIRLNIYKILMKCLLLYKGKSE